MGTALFGQVNIDFGENPLIRETENILLNLTFTKKTTIKAIELNFEMDDPSNLGQTIKEIRLYQSSKVGKVSTRKRLTSFTPESATQWINLNRNFSGLNKVLIMTAIFQSDAKLQDSFKLSISSVLDSNSLEMKLSDNNTNSPLFHLGYQIRKSGDDNVNTFRIPGLATTNQGTLIAVYDVRYNNAMDLPNPIDIGMSRSTDGGNSWEQMKIIMDMGNENESGMRGNGIGDPAILVDKTTGIIWVAAAWSHGNRAWVGSGQGISPEETGQFMLSKSDDDGLSWSDPINITSQIKNPKWHYLLQGPGAGITLSDGTILFPAQYQDESDDRTPFSTFIYSKDHGENWLIVDGPRPNTTESQVVELNDGSLMINCRDDRNRSGERSKSGGRAVYTTKNMGLSWEQHPSSDWTLPEPNCQASILRLDENHLVFFNPHSHRSAGVNGGVGGRRMFTLQLSDDEGLSWNKKILFDSGLGRGYSSMAITGDSLCILYEGSKSDLFFQKIKISELLSQNE